jgi:glycosyltransferase involved in cell wall biosynthesis
MRDLYHENIAVVTTSYPSHARDWAGHFVREEALELARRGASVTVMTTRAAISDANVRALAFGGGSAFGAPGALARIREFPPRALLAGAWAARVSDALRRTYWDRVIAHWAVPSALIAVAAQHVEVEVVSHGSDVRLLVALPPLARRAIVTVIAARASAWRFVSASLRDELVGALGGELALRVQRMSFVRAPSFALPDVSARAHALRTELGAFDVSVGRLVASKRVDKAIDRAVATRELLLVVGDGPARASLERRAKARGARVRFLGDLPRDEALAYVAAARSLVFASELEGCSTVVREARALGARIETI